jgi:Kef-type K+ transport system membrane component KefB
VVSPAGETAFSASTEGVLVHLLLQIVVILVASRGFGALFRRLGHAQSIGEILGGVLLGPSLVGWLVPGPWAWLFASDGPRLLPYLSHLGLVLALFLIGMEFDFDAVPKHGRTVTAVAVGTVVAPMAAAAALAPWLWSLAPGGGSYLAYVLFLGLLLTITAIPIMGRVLIETGLSQTRVGLVGITVGATKDLLTWLALLVVVGIARPPLDPLRLAAVGLGAAALAALSLTVGRRLIARAQAAFGWVDGRPSGHLVVFLLCYTFVLAATTATMGLFAIFGAFLAGVTVSSDRRLAAALVDRLNDLTIYLFLPIFFTATGLRTDLTQLSGELWLAVPVVTVVGTIASGGVAAAVARASGWPARESVALGALVNTPGLMVLILLNVGLDVGVIPASLFSVMMANAMLRNLLVTPTLRWADRGGALRG